MAKLSIRLDFAPGARLGPGKIELLEKIHALGSIAAAGRAMNMSYRRAWELVDEINSIFTRPLVVPQAGGKRGGGASLTPLGLVVVARFRAIERAAADAAANHIKAIEDEPLL